MGSLPRYLRSNRESFPARRRYLAADPAQTDVWRRRYSEIGEGLNVGISWQGGAKPDVRRLRSTSLEKWMPLLSTPGVQFINVQYGETDAELAAIRNRTGVTIHDWDDADPLVDLDNFAAQISALDLVISVDNSTVHMAAAVGRPVWTLLPFSPNWRWMLEDESSPWYSTMRLFRQPGLNDWPAVFEKVARELKTLSTAPPEHVAPNAGKPADFARPRPNPEAIQTLQPREPYAVGKPADNPNADGVAAREKAKYEHIWKHAAYRDHTPGYHDLDKVPLIEALRKRGVRSILDAGCGSGTLMQRIMAEYGSEFSVHGFDISENCLNPFFDAVKDEILTVGCLWDENDFNTEYDAIICSDVMEHIPTDKVPLVLKNFKNCARKICYLAIALVPDNFGPVHLGRAAAPDRQGAGLVVRAVGTGRLCHRKPCGGKGGRRDRHSVAPVCHDPRKRSSIQHVNRLSSKPLLGNHGDVFRPFHTPRPNTPASTSQFPGGTGIVRGESLDV